MSFHADPKNPINEIKIGWIAFTTGSESKQADYFLWTSIKKTICVNFTSNYFSLKVNHTIDIYPINFNDYLPALRGEIVKAS
ncbi:protein of unknown function [Xenorhabdus doucetiae]|uniref:Uncharacterized protein n=1 Tax=Xenorhabdus doucetiae TaxID=351671 RepID=A0A068QPZ2_9GAMM|nr:hypothetical protein LY16_03332 [Xenorhabdus doucetiae]CDG17112.1 protein of unknown function [Xenorhabdus doucetiae]